MKPVLSIVMLVADIAEHIEAMTRAAVDLVADHTQTPHELIVVLNGPTPWGDYTGISKATLLPLPEATSIASAYNQGFAQAQGDYFCCLHNDAYVTPGWDEPLVAVAARGNVAFPNLLEPVENCAWRGIPPSKPDECTGSCFVLPRALWEALGGYDEIFEGLHWEDTDLFYRARKAGAKLLRVPESLVVHWRGVTRSYLPDKGNGHLRWNYLKWYHKHEADKGKDGKVPYPKLDDQEGGSRKEEGGGLSSLLSPPSSLEKEESHV